MNLIDRTIGSVGRWLYTKAFAPGPGGIAWNNNAYTYDNKDDATLEKAFAINVWLNRAVNVIANTVADVPWKVYVENADGERDEVPDHPLAELLWTPGPFTSGTELKRDMAARATLSGENFLFIENGSSGEALSPVDVKRLQVLPSRFIKAVRFGADGMPSKYEYNQAGHEKSFDPEFIVHAKNFNPLSDTRGLSVIDVAQNPILLNYYMHRHNSLFFKQGANPGMVLTSPNKLNADSRQAIIDQLDSKYSGVEKSHKAMLADSGLTPHKIGIGAKEGEFVGLANLSRDEIVALLGVPPMIMGINEFAHYANAEQQMRIFYQQTVKPITTLLVDAMNTQMLPIWYAKDVESQGLHIDADYTEIDVLQADQEIEQRTLTGYVQGGVMTPNEARMKIGLGPVDDEKADTLKGSGPNPFENMTGDAGEESENPFEENEDDEGTPRGLLGGRRLLSAKATVKPTRVDQWKARDRDFIQAERRIERTMVAFFDEQLDRITSRLEDVPELELAAPGNGSNRIRFAMPEHRKFSLEDLGYIWLADDENQALLAVMRPLLEDLINQAGNGALAEVGASALFNVADPRVSAFLAQKELTLAGINGTTLELLQTIIADAAGEGVSVGEIGRRIRDQYKDMTRWRSETIARTEAVSGNNFAAIEGYKQSGVVEKKEWLVAAGAAHPRHELTPGLDGQIVPIDSMFDVNGFAMPTPGVGGPPEEVINCRCTVLPVIGD